jgi:hypothetical protein
MELRKFEILFIGEMIIQAKPVKHLSRSLFFFFYQVSEFRIKTRAKLEGPILRCFKVLACNYQRVNRSKYIPQILVWTDSCLAKVILIIKFRSND